MQPPLSSTPVTFSSPRTLQFARLKYHTQLATMSFDKNTSIFPDLTAMTAVVFECIKTFRYVGISLALTYLDTFANLFSSV